MADELQSTQKLLQCELKWKETAESTHKQLLVDKSELCLKMTQLEDALRDKSHKIVELECRMNRILQENKLLEDRSRMTFGDSSSSLSLPLSPIQVMHS